MKHYNLYLENIRLKHMEMLLNEASTDLEVIRGTRIINESLIFLKDMLEESFKFDSQAKLQKFARRGIKAANTVSDTQRTIGQVAPITGVLAGGAIGNQIHGDSGVHSQTGNVYDPQAHNDDEYDLTGAAIGGAIGLGASALAGNRAITKPVMERMIRDGYQPNKKDYELLKHGAKVTHLYNTFYKN